RPWLVFRTTARFMRLSPAPSTPRRPAVPNSKGPEKRATSSSERAAIRASSSARVTGSGSWSRQRRAASRTASVGTARRYCARNRRSTTAGRLTLAEAGGGPAAQHHELSARRSDIVAAAATNEAQIAGAGEDALKRQH